jgi:hypothetical protein
MYNYIKSANDGEITLKDKVNELGDKFAYIEQSIYLLEGTQDSNEILAKMNEYLDECMSMSANAISDNFAQTEVNSATNTANISAKPCMDIFGGECAENFADMVKDGLVSILITEPDDEFNKFAINESRIPESLQNALALLDENDGEVEGADAILFWTVPTEFTADDVNGLQSEVERYFKEYQKLMGCEDDTLNLALWVSEGTSDNEEATEIRTLTI